jgi:hypothetical protein
MRRSGKSNRLVRPFLDVGSEAVAVEGAIEHPGTVNTVGA